MWHRFRSWRCIRPDATALSSIHRGMSSSNWGRFQAAQNTCAKATRKAQVSYSVSFGRVLRWSGDSGACPLGGVGRGLAQALDLSAGFKCGHFCASANVAVLLGWLGCSRLRSGGLVRVTRASNPVCAPGLRVPGSHGRHTYRPNC
jgi:hypothetical protein